MQTSQKEITGPKSPQATANGHLAGLAAAESTGEALALTLEIIKGLGACPERIKLVRNGREETVTGKTRQSDPKAVDVENRVPGGTRVIATCAGPVGPRLRKEIEAVLRVAALTAELCARKLWRPGPPGAGPHAATGIVGGSAAALEHVREIEILARSNHPVMITGERGTGKTTTAQAIHEQSARRGRPFQGVCHPGRGAGNIPACVLLKDGLSRRLARSRPVVSPPRSQSQLLCRRVRNLLNPDGRAIIPCDKDCRR